MNLYFDNNLIVEKDSNEFIIYSPFNHKWIKGNQFLKDFINLLLNLGSNIEIKKVKDIFNKQHTADISSEDLDKLIKTLVREELLFTSKEQFEQAKKKAKQAYQLPKNQELELVYLHLTLRCNFNCSYCYNKNIDAAKTELDASQWINIIENLKENHPTIKEIIFTGGEPLVRDDLEEIMQKIKSGEINYTLLTNGSLLKDRFTTLVPYFDNVIMSLDSLDEKINALNRSKKGFDNIVDTIRLFSEQAPDKLVVRTVVTKNNLFDVADFNKQLATEYGIETQNNWFLPVSRDEIDEVPGPEYFDIAIDKEAEYPINTSGTSIRRYRCGACSNIIAIDPSGDIYPCQSLLHDNFKITNILKDNWYQNLLTSDIREKFINLSINEIDKCKDCSYRYFCGGGCPAIAFKVYGNLDSHLDYFCDHLKKQAKHRLKSSNVEWQKAGK